jgi:hypothetical protein
LDTGETTWLTNRAKYLEDISSAEVETYISDKFGKMLIELSAGYIFGELALIEN